MTTTTTLTIATANTIAAKWHVSGFEADAEGDLSAIEPLDSMRAAELEAALVAAGFESSVSRDDDGQSWVWLVVPVGHNTATLHDYDTAEEIRTATVAERDESRETATRDGGAGVIRVDGRRCYVQE
jgi:hypothetical protein